MSRSIPNESERVTHSKNAPPAPTREEERRREAPESSGGDPSRLGESLHRDGSLARSLLEVIPDLVFRLDEDGTFLDFLPARGLDPYVPAGDFLGKNLGDVFPAFAGEALLRAARARETGVEQTLVYDLPIAGTKRFYEARFIASGRREVVVLVRDVTEKRATEEKLRLSEERFRSLVETAGDVILWLAPDGDILEFNREAERLYGRKREEVLGNDYFELLVPESHRSAIRAEVVEVLQGIPTRGFESPVSAADGRTRVLSWNIDRVLDGEGRPAGFIACGHDVTDQKELEESVLRIAKSVSAATGDKFFRHLASGLASLLGADHVLIGELDELAASPRIRTIARVVDGKLAGNVVYELAGSPCENVVGKRVCVYPAGVHELFPRDRALALQAIEGYVGAPLFDSKDRALGLIVVLYKRPIPNVRLVESVLRIFATRASGELERKIAQEELRASEQLNRRIIEAMPGGVVRVASDGSILLANEPAQRFLGLAYDEESARYVGGFREQTLIDEDRSLLAPNEGPLTKCLRTGLPQPPRVIGIRSAAAVRWGIFTAVPLAGADEGKLDGAVLMFVDITDRKNAEEERRRLEAQVQHAQKLESLGVLAGGIAHDFNNLLTGILGNVSLAMMKLPPGSELAVSLGRVERAAERAAQLTNQMLAYAGKGSFDVGSVALNSVIRELVPLLQSSVTKKAKLELELDPKLLDIEGDRSQIEQVVMNLITNASDALDEGEGVIRLRTGVTRDVRGLDRESPFVTLEVADTGKGMDDETRARMFDPFFTTKFTGRGLGLAAVQGIVRGHRGSIRVETRPAAGTKFTVLFPAGAAVRTAPERGAPRMEARGTGTILVIDDEEIVREVIRSALEDAGYRVLLAKDGIEGVETFRSRSSEVAAAVVDVSMPRMSGEETLRQLRAVAPALPVLLTSGYTEQAARERLATADVAAFIQKPFRSSDLVEKVGRLIQSR